LQPLKLKLKNFRTLADTELDLSAISLASIVAPNGRGKSTLFTYAPLFALFGKYPGGSIDDLVRTGTQDMSATFDFEHNGEIYQVTRTRKLGKKSTCEFQRQISGGWESLSGATIKETDAKIEELINLDAETFLSTSLILQNDVANFSRKLPSERKRVLASILGLDVYGDLQEQAKAKARTLELKLEGDKQELERLSARLEELPEHEEGLEYVNAMIAARTSVIEDEEKQLSDYQKEIKLMEMKQQEIKNMEDQIAYLTLDVGSLKDQIKVCENRMKEAEEILQYEPGIIMKLAELSQLRQEVTLLESNVNRAQELRVKWDKVLDDISAWTNDENALAHKILEIKQELLIKPELEQAKEHYEIESAKLKTIVAAAEKHQKLNDELNVAEKELLRASNYLDGLLNEYHQLEKKTELLRDSNCIDPDNANCRFLQDAITAKEMLPQKQAEIEQARAGLIPPSDKREAIEQEIEALAYDRKSHIEVQAKVDDLQKSVDRYNALAGKEELLVSVENQKEGITERIDALHDEETFLQQNIEQLEEEMHTLPSLRESIAALEIYEKKAEELPQARANIQAMRANIEKLEFEIADKREREINLRLAHDAILADNSFDCTIDIDIALQEAREEEGNIQRRLKEHQLALNELFARQGTLKAQRDSLLADQAKHAEISEILAPQAKELTRWETLAKAFGKNGIPVLILENALPELEQIANDILGQMSNGQHNLQFVTQRDAKSKDSVIETLDIIVRDWAGTRPFESFSGGEQTRISLAIRFALSELLANRAGSKIEFIVGDEILSDQSPEFRDMTIEAIKSLSERFKKILVISHIPEIQGAFDQQINILENGKVEVSFN
jgi:exonuclease SbcC